MVHKCIFGVVILSAPVRSCIRTSDKEWRTHAGKSSTLAGKCVRTKTDEKYGKHERPDEDWHQSKTINLKTLLLSCRTLFGCLEKMPRVEAKQCLLW